MMTLIIFMMVKTMGDVMMANIVMLMFRTFAHYLVYSDDAMV